MSSLRSLNVRVGKKRTSMRMEPEMWAALDEAAREKGCTRDELVTTLSVRRRSGSLTSAVRVWLLLRYKEQRDVGRAA